MTPRFTDLDRPALDAVGLRDGLLRPLGQLSRLEVVEETGSTNSDLAAYAAADPSGWPDLSVLTAELQSAGRGRLERRWSAPARSSLAVSVLLRPAGPRGEALPAEAYPWLSLLAALSLVEMLQERAEISAGIKWPNDVLIDGRKTAGILAQLVPAADGAAAAVVVGMGLNVSLKAAELPIPTATSLRLERAATTNRNILLKAYLRRLAANYAAFCAAGGDALAPWDGGPSLHGRVSSRMETIGQQVRAELPGGGGLTGIAVGLGSDGALSVRTAADEVRTVSAGDVVHLRRTGNS